jgi:hypothetical protein
LTTQDVHVARFKPNLPGFDHPNNSQSLSRVEEQALRKYRPGSISSGAQNKFKYRPSSEVQVIVLSSSLQIIKPSDTKAT